MDLLEVITQNGIKEPINQLAIVRTVLRGETLTTLDTAVSDKTLDAEGKPVELTPAIFKEVMTEVTKTIFPYRALVTGFLQVFLHVYEGVGRKIQPTRYKTKRTHGRDSFR